MNKKLTKSNNSVKSSANSRPKKRKIIRKRKKGVFVFGCLPQFSGVCVSGSSVFVFGGLRFRYNPSGTVSESVKQSVSQSVSQSSSQSINQPLSQPVNESGSQSTS